MTPRLPPTFASLVLTCCAVLGLQACGGAAAEVSPPLAAPPEAVAAADPAPTPAAPADTSPAAASATPPQTQALEACQAARELLDAGDAEGAILQLDRAYELMLSLPDDVGDSAQTKQDIRLVVAELIGRAYRAASPAAVAVPSRDLGLPMVDNEHVQREIRSFTTVERDGFLAGYKRSGRYRPMILKKLEEAGLPSQLSWLPLVESLFKVSALSRASALGLWQFISSTGLRYGLTRDESIDERLDPERSTDAAVAYLLELHRIFGDWQKALAAYNCGENRILSLQKRSASDYLDFWDLYLLLPAETRRYVPRLIAAIRIIEDPTKYGITLPELDAPLGEAELVQVDKAVKLEALDGALSLPAGTLAAHNAALRFAATPKAPYALRVPAGQGAAALAAVQALPEYQPPKPKYLVHHVRSGETLSTIAERYRTSISLIMQFNNLRSANRIWPGQRLRVPVRN